MAAALQRYWDERERRPVGFVAELARIADLDSAARAQLKEALARALRECSGDPRKNDVPRAPRTDTTA